MWGSGSGVGVSSVCVLVCPVTFTGLLSAGPEDLGVLFFRFARRGPGLASMHPLRRLHRTNSADHPESAISPSVGVKLQQAVPPSDANGVQAPAKHWAIPRAWHRKRDMFAWEIGRRLYACSCSRSVEDFDVGTVGGAVVWSEHYLKGDTRRGRRRLILCILYLYITSKKFFFVFSFFGLYSS